MKRTNGRAISGAVAALLLATLLIATTKVAAAESRVERDGLVIRLEEIRTPVPSYTTFRISLRNKNDAPRTLYGRITLDAKDSADDANSEEKGSCIVYLEVAAGSETVRDVPCRGEGYNFWNFYILKIYDFSPPPAETPAP